LINSEHRIPWQGFKRQYLSSSSQLDHRTYPAQKSCPAYAVERLEATYLDAEIVPFDDQSRLIFFSDCHRGDKGAADQFKQNERLFLSALRTYDQAGYIYVEVGDGDDLWLHRSFDRVKDSYPEIFSYFRRLYREGRLHFILGNHDQTFMGQRWSNKVGIPLREGLIFKHQDTGQEIFVFHGHQADYVSDRLAFIGRRLVRHVWRRVLQQGWGEAIQELVGKRGGLAIQNRILAWMRGNQRVVITGHTHQLAFPTDSRLPYYNTGSCSGSSWITGIEVADGFIVPVRWRLQPGTLRNPEQDFLREWLAPPRHLREFIDNSEEESFPLSWPISMPMENPLAFPAAESRAPLLDWTL